MEKGFTKKHETALARSAFRGHVSKTWGYVLWTNQIRYSLEFVLIVIVITELDWIWMASLPRRRWGYIVACRTAFLSIKLLFRLLIRMSSISLSSASFRFLLNLCKQLKINRYTVCFTDLGKLELRIVVWFQPRANFWYCPSCLKKWSLLQKWLESFQNNRLDNIF